MGRRVRREERKRGRGEEEAGEEGESIWAEGERQGQGIRGKGGGIGNAKVSLRGSILPPDTCFQSVQRRGPE